MSKKPVYTNRLMSSTNNSNKIDQKSPKLKREKSSEIFRSTNKENEFYTSHDSDNIKSLISQVSNGTSRPITSGHIQNYNNQNEK